MPELGGRALGDGVAMCATAARVRYMSGFAESDLVDRGVDVPDGLVLAKPFTPAQLPDAVGTHMAHDVGARRPVGRDRSPLATGPRGCRRADRVGAGLCYGPLASSSSSALVARSQASQMVCVT